MVEIELKYQFDGEDVAQRWTDRTALEGGFTVVQAPHPTVRVCDLYLDTRDYQLLRNGFSLRHRRKGGDSLLTLKSIPVRMNEGSAEESWRRLEIEQPLENSDAAGDPANWPAEIRNRLADLLDGRKKLHPIALIHQSRDKRIVESSGEQAKESGCKAEDAEPFRAELSIDHVDVLAPHGSDPANLDDDVLIDCFYELEVELLAGDESYLGKIDRLLAVDEDLQPHRASKLEQALTRIAAHEPGAPSETSGVRPDLSMAEAGRLILRIQLTEMLLLEAGVRTSDDIEYVHDMRVAIRRTRAALTLFAAYLDAKHLRRFNRVLRKTGRKLGKVRDLDVAIDKGEQTAGTGDDLLDEWRTARHKAHIGLVQWLDGKEFRRFLRKYDRFCRTPRLGVQQREPKAGKSPQPQIVAHVVPGLLIQRFEQVRAYETLFQRDEAVPYATIHALRIDCKNLRYCLEFFQGILGNDATVLINRLKKLQDLLGDLNDAVVATSLLEDRPEKDAEGRAHLALQCEITRKLYDRVPDHLVKFTRHDTRKRLGRAVMRI